MGIEWVRIYNSKPEVKNGSGKEIGLWYAEVAGRVMLAELQQSGGSRRSL